MPYLHKSIRVRYLCQGDLCQREFTIISDYTITEQARSAMNEEKTGESTSRYSLKNKKELLSRPACSLADGSLRYPIADYTVFMWIPH